MTCNLETPRPVPSGGPRIALGLVIYTAAVIVTGSLAAYVLHRGFGTGSADYPELVLRCTELAGLVCVVAWLSLEGRMAPRWWGLVGGWRTHLMDAAIGFGFGAACILVVVLVLVSLGDRVVHPLPGPGALGLLLLKGAIVGLAVAVIEELWFRGGLFGALMSAPVGEGETKVAGDWGAVLTTSVIFAAVHFIEPDPSYTIDTPGPFSGLGVFSASCARFTDPTIIAPALALALAGLGAALARQRSGRVGPCIGLHVGWVCLLYTSKKLTELTPAGAEGPWAGGYDGVVAGVAAGVFALAAWGLVRFYDATSPPR